MRVCREAGPRRQGLNVRILCCTIEASVGRVSVHVPLHGAGTRTQQERVFVRMKAKWAGFNIKGTWPPQTAVMLSKIRLGFKGSGHWGELPDRVSGLLKRTGKRHVGDAPKVTLASPFRHLLAPDRRGELGLQT